MKSKNLITDKEHIVIFNPSRTINKSEINNLSIEKWMKQLKNYIKQTKRTTMNYSRSF